MKHHVRSDTAPIEVRNNNINKAMRILKKRLTEEGIFNELREREFYVSKSEKKLKKTSAEKRRNKRNLEKRMEELGY